MTISVVAMNADLAAEQAEAAVDIAGEDLQELVDDAGAAHGSPPVVAAAMSGRLVRRADDRGSGRGFRPRRAGSRIARAASPRAWQRRSSSRSGIGRSGAARARRPRALLLLPGHLDRRRRDGDGDEDDGADAREGLPSMREGPQLPFGNMRALPG
jgi:hypothetical protein